MRLTKLNKTMKNKGMLLRKQFCAGVTAICLTTMLTSCAPTLSVQQQTSNENGITVDTTVYPYPMSGQTKEQQDRDYYECSMWAIEKSGFDPELERLASEKRLEVVSTSPPGSNVVGGVAAGAIMGSILAGPRHHVEGLIFGTITGLFVGLATEHAKTDQVKNLQAQLNEQEWLRLEELADKYRRAMSACFEGRDYEVR